MNSSRSFLKFALFVILVVTFGVPLAFAVSLQDAMPPGMTDVLAVLTRWPAGRNEWLLVAFGFFGMNCHWYNKRRLGETLDSWSDHFLMVNPHYMVGTVVVFWFLAMVVLSTVAISTAKWPGAVVCGIVLGWMVDSWIDKAEK